MIVELSRQGNYLMTPVFSGHTPHIIQEKYLRQFFYFRRLRSQPFCFFKRGDKRTSKTPESEEKDGSTKMLIKMDVTMSSFKIKL